MGSAMGHVSLRVAIKIEQETGFSYSVLLNKSKPASTNPSNYFLFHSVPFCSEFYTFLHKPWHLQAQAGHLWWGISQLLLLVHQLADEFDLCKGRKALTAISGRYLWRYLSDVRWVTLANSDKYKSNRASISPLTRSTFDRWKNSALACFQLFQREGA